MHDCVVGGCLEDGEEVVFQERETTTKKVAVVRHRDEERFVINTCAFHNIDVLMSALPQELSHSPSSEGPMDRTPRSRREDEGGERKERAEATQWWRERR